MKINIKNFIIDEFEKTNYKKYKSYKAFLELYKKEKEIENKYPFLKSELMLLSDLHTDYLTLRLDEFVGFAIDFFKNLYR